MLVRRNWLVCFCAVLTALEASAVDTKNAGQQPKPTAVEFEWGVKVPLRDGAVLNATAYRPKSQPQPAPCIVTVTPYIGQSYHDRGMYFAAHGLPFLAVDARGRGNSEGRFRPFIQEARDGYDVVEWLAKKPYCNGKVAMWGGSYAGYNQWATAKELPPHLVTFVPVASVYPGRDFPMRNNIAYTYAMQWLTYVSGRASQQRIFGDSDFWTAIKRAWFSEGEPFNRLDSLVGNRSEIFQEWNAHPSVDEFWDNHAPTAEQYARLQIPILTITGSYDDDQVGALTFYREHLHHATQAAAARHFLVIGPWDHAGTRTPRASFGGLEFGPESLVDLPKLHLDWYAWTMQAGQRPSFLKKRVAYYVTGAERWRFADSLDETTSELVPMLLHSNGNASDVFASGGLSRGAVSGATSDSYTYDPRDTSRSELETSVDLESFSDQLLVLAARGSQLVYHSEPFRVATEITGFFRLAVWVAIDQPDTDFQATVYEIRPDGRSVLLSTDVMRARYRESLRIAKHVEPHKVLRYDFDRFTFISRLVEKGSRLRLVISPINSINWQKNYNSGGVVSEESMDNARPVKVTLVHDKAHPSALFVPIGTSHDAAH